MNNDAFEPKIVAFLCTGADLAGTSRIQYPPNVRIIRLMCSGAVDPTYVLKPLLDGADGVLAVTPATATISRGTTKPGGASSR